MCPKTRKIRTPFGALNCLKQLGKDSSLVNYLTVTRKIE